MSTKLIKTELGRNEVISILHQNFGYPVIDTCIGTAIEIDPYNAFLYTVVTGASYLDNPIFPFTPKGNLKLFYNAFDYKFVTGIFDNTSLRQTPYYMSLGKPYIIRGAKFIVPVEFEREEALFRQQEDFIKKNMR